MAERWTRFAQLTKFDAFTGEFEAVMTDETPDGVNEVMDYETSKPHIQEWSGFFDKATNGESVGNVREMHGLKAAGKLLAIDFDDAKRQVPIRGKAVDSEVRKKLAEGVYTGVSIGGDYVKRWIDPARPGLTRYTAKPIEVSLVDYPCNPNATFTLVRAGIPTLHKFQFKTYAAISDLPVAQVKDYSDHQKEIFRAAFNASYTGTCAQRADRESCAFAIAHSAAQKAAEFGDLVKEQTHPDDEGDMDAQKAAALETQLAALEKELGIGALHKDGDPNAHAKFVAGQHERMAAAHAKLAEHYRGGAKGEHTDDDEEAEKARTAEKLEKAAPAFVTKADLETFGKELVTGLLKGLTASAATVPARTDPAALKAVEADPAPKTGDERMDKALADPTVAFIRKAQKNPMTFRSVDDIGYRGRSLNRR